MSDRQYLKIRVEQLRLALLPAAQPLQLPADRRVGRLDPLLVAKKVCARNCDVEDGFGQIRPPARPLAQVNVDLHGQLVRPRLRRLDEDVPRLPLRRATSPRRSASGLSVFGRLKTRACRVSKGSETRSLASFFRAWKPTL